MRFEKRHTLHEQDCEGDDYMTPTQRKDQLLKDLKVQVKDLTSEIEARDSQIERLKQDIDEEARKIIEQKNEEAKQLQSNLDSLQTEHDDLMKSYQKSLCSIVELEESVSHLHERISIQEKRNERLYLEMYKKGQESAQFERNVELERLAVNSQSSSMTMKELIRKLVITESELAKWQSLRRQESYESAEKPETEADVTLKFLKDTFFHYLTDVKESDRYLRAMIRIFNYTDVQKKKISTCVTEKQNKSA
ncbi:desmoplakin-like [Pecten maximus]|uniref:desmoplakin-like n=1 Tax=Pecten maximus TaxID=6579 RepID=UPI00145881AF|nr:desmoplakin-like [Pecten maximus]